MLTVRRLIASMILAAVAVVPACTTAAERPCPEAAAAIALAPPVAKEISIEQLKRMLPSHPIVVGFDVDDTLVFSAPAFNALLPQYDEKILRSKNYAALTPEQKAQYHDFWNKLNKEYDDRSTPKKIGQQLLDLHVARGDTIIIISKRQSCDDGSDPCTSRYEKMFHVKFAKPVIQTQLKDKTPFICREKIEYYYGDADTDVTAAVAAGATPIRVKRSPNSYSHDVVHNGQLNEIVLENSEE